MSEIILVDAGPARSHAHRLLGMGLRQVEIARRADVDRQAINDLLSGDNACVARELATAVLAVDLDTRRGDWAEAAACRTPEAKALAYSYGLDNPTELFIQPEGLDRSVQRELSAAADSLCARCPVRDQCKKYADETSRLTDLVGRWAGANYRLRRTTKGTN